MSIDDAVRARGFRRWYERQLIESHAYLVTLIMTLIAMAIALEVIAFRESLASALTLTLVEFVGGALCIFAWNKFHHMLVTAEHLAEQAVCSQCHVYGRLAVLEARNCTDTATGRLLRVRCRGCAHEWQMG
jgi:hypothetical protein